MRVVFFYFILIFLNDDDIVYVLFQGGIIMKKTISLILSIIMLATCFTTLAFAENKGDGQQNR